MASSKFFISALKKELRAQGVSYKDVATALDLSEASIKKMFANNRFSVERMDRICKILGMELSDLSDAAKNLVPAISQLSLEQEKELVSDTRLLLVAYCVFNYWTVEEIVDTYDLSAPECISNLIRLDRMSIIQLQMNNRIRLLISPNFSWQKNGPIENFFHKQVQSQFFDSRFDAEDELQIVGNNKISSESRKKIINELKTVKRNFEEYNKLDRKENKQMKMGTTMIIAIRQWEFEAFTSLEKDTKN